MAALIWTLLLFAGAVSASTIPNRIVGGEATTVENYPSIVQVEFYSEWLRSWTQSCAANILTSRYVLSAAHCFEGISYRSEWRRIRAGATFRQTAGFLSFVDQEYNHPSYMCCNLHLDGDISVIRLIHVLPYTDGIQPGTIIAQGTVLPDNLPVVHAGWGAFREGGPTSARLLDVTVYTVNFEVCRDRYLTLPDPDLVTENMICAGILDVGGKGACHGDSGGPLYYQNIIVGLVSWSHGCANETFPTVSTAVAPYTDWIVSVAV